MTDTQRDKLEAAYGLLSHRIKTLQDVNAVGGLGQATHTSLSATIGDLALCKERLKAALTERPTTPTPASMQGGRAPVDAVLHPPTPAEAKAIFKDMAARAQPNPAKNYFEGLLPQMPGHKIMELPQTHGDDATVVNEHGGRQSYLGADFTLLPPRALLAVARIMFKGCQKYGRDNWRMIPVLDNLNHAIAHGYKHLAGDAAEYHLANFATRGLFALELHEIAQGR